MSKLTSSTATNEPNLRTRFSAHRKTSGGGEAGPHGDAVRREDLEERPRVGREDLVARPYGEEPAAVEESDPGGVLGLVHVGGRDDDGEAAVVQLGEDLPELAARDGVDPGRRLVEEEEVRARQEGGDEGELLLHPPREVSGEALSEAVHPDARQEVRCPPLRLGNGDGVEAGPEVEVLVDGQVLVNL